MPTYSLTLRQDLGRRLTITEMDSNFLYLQDLALSGGTGSGGGGLAGTQYIFVAADGTPVENALELQTAYDQAKTLSPAADNRITVIAAPGEYAFNGPFTMDEEYIDLVSLTGNRDVIFDRADIVGDPLDVDPYYQLVSSIGECLIVSADNVFVKGIKGKLRQSPTLDMLEGTPDYVLPIQIGDDLSGLVMENCEGGAFSFGGDITLGNNPIEVSGTFTNCVGGVFSFGGFGVASGDFTNCVGDNFSFGSFGTASGTFTNCVGDENSFGGGGIASGTFTNCQGGNNSFGGNGGGSGTLNGFLYFCRKTAGDFQTLTAPGLIRASVDGNNQFIDSLDA